MNKEQINKLLSCATFNHSPIIGTLIETHISWVILGRQHVFKIKKPVHYSFLDYSTLAKRKFYCQREVTLNRRLSDIYLDVIPIRETSDGFLLGKGNKKGIIVDHAVLMKRMQEGKRMDHQLRYGTVKLEHIKLLASKIANFHQRAEIIYTPFNKTESKDDFNDIQSISDWVRKQLGKKYCTMLENAIINSNSFIDRNSSLITQRIEQGFKRDGHGDLHSRNIFLYRDPIIFDCIDFNDSFRQIDVLNELAFFCMDLEAFDRWDLSQQFMTDYLVFFPCLNTLEEMRLFTYYKAYRANIRAKVNALRAMQTIDKREIEKFQSEVKKYLKLMRGFSDKCSFM